jgi:SRSO17 transposase
LSREKQAYNAVVGEELKTLLTRIAPRFRRPEVRKRVGCHLAVLIGQVGQVERPTGQQIAEQLGEGRADGVQRLLNEARWDADAVRDDLRDYVVERLGDRTGALVLVEIGFPKKGPYSAGVARQPNPTTGRREDCQVGLFLVYASPRGWAFIDRALYLPEEWVVDMARRRQARVPEEVTFATKGELARRMLGRAFEANVPAAWITGGETYGRDMQLRHWLEEEGRSYMLAERRSGELLARSVLPPVSQWRAIGTESEATRAYQWAYGAVFADAATRRARWILARRLRARQDEYSYYAAYGPRKTSLAELVRATAMQGVVQEGLQQAKDGVVLDQYEVRLWHAWHRHITLCLLAHASLQVTRARAASGGDRRSPA